MRPTLADAPTFMAIGLVGFVLIMRAIRRVWLQGNDLLARRLCAGLLVAWLLGVFFSRCLVLR